MTGERTFLPRSRRTGRLAVGVAFGALAVAGNLVAYTSLHGREPVVQVVSDVPAGTLISRDMVRTVEVDADSSVAVVAGGDLDLLVGQHAKVRLVAGSLVTWPAVQSEPLVSPGNAIVALQLPEGELPSGLRERVPVRLILPSRGDSTGGGPGGGPGGGTVVDAVEGRLVGLPRPSESGVGTVSISVEVADGDAASVAAAERVRVVLLVPTEDPAATEGGS